MTETIPSFVTPISLDSIPPSSFYDENQPLTITVGDSTKDTTTSADCVPIDAPIDDPNSQSPLLDSPIDPPLPVTTMPSTQLKKIH